jgi:predicted site-specific integrase-resolvase
MQDKLISIKQASKLLGISEWTLRRYDNEYIQAMTTKGGHRRYRESDILKLQGIGVLSNESNSECVCLYCRVSSNSQKTTGDLDRQKMRMVDYATSKKYKIGYILEEVGSGMSDTRCKLLKLFKLAKEHKINKVIVEHKDRLTRFNFNIYKQYFDLCNVEIEWAEETLPKSFEDELVEDMLSLLSSFSAKIYGKRSSQNKKKNKENENK